MSAPRWMRALARDGAVLLPLAGSDSRYGVYPRADRRRRPVARAARGDVEAAARKGWLENRGPGQVLSATGRSEAGREPDEGAEPAARHRTMADRPVMSATGRIETARANLREGALGKWTAWLEPGEREAGERFLRDYHCSTLSQTITRNWSPVPSRRGEGKRSGPEDATLSAMAARDRVMDTLDHLGPAMARIIEAALVHEESLAAMERRFGWAQRSGRTALKLALARLAEIYGCG